VFSVSKLGMQFEGETNVAATFLLQLTLAMIEAVFINDCVNDGFHSNRWQPDNIIFLIKLSEL
jgi:hypothetical protein